MKILDLLFPPTCEFCGKVGKYVCDNCYKKVIYLELKKEEKNDKFFMYKYDNEIRKLILKYKFEDKSYLCNFFADKILNSSEAVEFIKQYDIIVPVPLHKKRFLERGYNQTKEVAKIISNKINKNVLNKIKANEVDERTIGTNNIEKNTIKVIKLENDVLKKNKNIAPQSTKKVEARLSDVKNVFYVKNADKIKNKNVLIFDDIYTTGATASECKKVLMEAGAKKCGIMTIARDFMK